MRKLFCLLLTLLFVFAAVYAQAVTPIKVLKTKIEAPQPAETEIMKTIRAHIDVEKYREVKVQLIRTAQGKPSHYLVYLLSKTSHRVDVARIAIDEHFKVKSVQHNYRLQDIDFKQQPGIQLTHATCPDNSTQFIAFAPNDIQVEQDVTIDAANAATAANLKTVKLLKNQATRDNYLKYLSCPNVLGNFYDGDSNPQLFITVDGVISADDIKTILSKKFQYRMTNIWLACEAFNDPMLSAVIDGAEARKYAAGINDLAVGPSDKAGACAMKAAIAKKPMKASFDGCYQQFDIQSDHWGWGGNGTDDFWNNGYYCNINSPNPNINFDHKDAQGRVYIPVVNWSSYNNDLFQKAPDLPACGKNSNSARTWVDIYNADTNKRIYGFCALGNNADLKNIWFMPGTAHGHAYITINDRACKTAYKSNTIAW